MRGSVGLIAENVNLGIVDPSDELLDLIGGDRQSGVQGNGLLADTVGEVVNLVRQRLQQRHVIVRDGGVILAAGFLRA